MRTDFEKLLAQFKEGARHLSEGDSMTIEFSSNTPAMTFKGPTTPDELVMQLKNRLEQLDELLTKNELSVINLLNEQNK